MDQHSFQFRLGFAWIGLALALGLHVVDEATTGFLAVYNPTVIEARSRWSWFPMPTFAFNDWLFGLTAFVILLLTLSPLAFRNARGIRPIAYFLSAVMLLNAVGHTLATIAGRTFASIRFQRPAPGFYSSPVLVVASVYLLVQLRRTRDARRGIAAVGSS
jgi:hypothetical protein